MDEIMNTQKKIAKKVILFNSIAGLAGSLFLRPVSALWMGLLFGTLISLLNFRLLYLTLNRAVTMAPAKAQKYTTFRYLIRYLLTAVVLVVSLRSPNIHTLGTVIGLLMIKMVVLQQSLFNDSKYFKNIISGKEEK
ncbi:ATP synthase subunit I [Tindallia californiensis]|uniref:ATP synthase I chain n=1 Tax=Tindallia californiensis TaxID=159292 RepID=A0A1H3LHN1_9FIRM|nr:ATP synthase subunit I [Tindallia californiensis]SDY63444.1 ATP synthase I chain [Tindallia californiensis]